MIVLPDTEDRIRLDITPERDGRMDRTGLAITAIRVGMYIRICHRGKCTALLEVLLCTA